MTEKEGLWQRINKRRLKTTNDQRAIAHSQDLTDLDKTIALFKHWKEIAEKDIERCKGISGPLAHDTLIINESTRDNLVGVLKALDSERSPRQGIGGGGKT